MTNIEERQIENQAEIIREETEDLLESSRRIEASVLTASTSVMSFGKSLDQWQKELTLPVDSSADPAKIKFYCSKLAESMDIAYRNLSRAKTLAFSYGLSYNNVFNEKIASQALNRTRKVAPAMDTMVKIAESQLPERTLTQKRILYTVEFWEGMIWKIKDKVNLIRIMSMANGTMGKIGEF